MRKRGLLGQTFLLVTCCYQEGPGRFRNEAQKLNQFRQTLTSGNVDKINMELRLDYIPNNAYLAVLRIAYLAMFREVGYKYVLAPAADVIRKLIASFPDPQADLGRIVAEAKNVSPPSAEPLQFFDDLFVRLGVFQFGQFFRQNVLDKLLRRGVTRGLAAALDPLPGVLFQLD